MTHELDDMSDQAPRGRTPGRTAALGTSDKRWTQRWIERWSHFRELLHGLRVAWVSTASALIGLLLYYKAAQAQDLFLEVKGHPLSDALFWGGFYLAVVLAWALPVFVSTRWILARFEEGPHAHPHVQPVKTWVRRRLPLLLGAACLAAVFFGQLMAIHIAPTIHDPSHEDVIKRSLNVSTKAPEGCERTSNAACIISAIEIRDPTVVVGVLIAEYVGRENVQYVANAIAACVWLWFWFARPSAWSSQLMTTPYARRVIVALASFTSLALVAWASLLLLLLITGVEVSNYAAPALSLLVVGILAARGMERTLWWLGTILAIPIAAPILFAFYAYVWLELQSAFGLAHLVVLPTFTVLMGVLLWWALAPFSDGRASRVGQLFHHIRGGHGKIGEDEATLRFINPLFGFLLVLTFLVIVALVVVHPLNVTGPFWPHRAVLLPVLLGMPVALFTYITHWSARVRAPLIFALVLVVGAIGVLLGDNHNIRTVQGAPPRMTLKDAVDQWVAVNGCKDNPASCPRPLIIVAAGGASRSAFHVAGVVGNLLDEQRFSPLRGHRDFVMAASFSPDQEGTRILTASHDGTAKIWDAATGQLLRVLGSPTTEIDRAKIDKAKFIHSAKFSPDGKLVVTASADKAATIWDAKTAEVVRKLEPHEGDVTSAEFSAKGDLVVTTSTDKLVRIWRVKTGELVHKLQGHRSAVNSAVFHPDGTKVASGSNDGTIRMWDVAGQDAHEQYVVRHDWPVWSVAFSPDRKRLITASEDGTAQVWDAATGGQLNVLKGHSGSVKSAAFSDDATKIVTASWDGTIRIWDATAYGQLKVLRAHSGEVNSAAFSRNGKRIVTASNDRTVRVWNAQTYERHPWRAAARFGNQLFAITAVSGGSLAAVLTYAALADARRENPTGTGAGLPPCTEKGLHDADWFGAQVRGKEVRPANPTQSWRDCLQLLSAGDFLSPVFVSMLSNDSLRIELRGNRAVVLEHAWEVRYARLTGRQHGLGIVKKEDADTTLAQSLSMVRHKAAGRGIWLPILLLNGTSVGTGRRIVTSDVLVRDANGKGVIVDSYDLHELFGRSASKDESVTGAKLACEGCDIRLSTAATMSARFPLISPPGSIIGADGKTIDRVVDGGFYEYFGATTAMELADALPTYDLPKPILILINNDPHSSEMECVRGGLEYPSPQSTPWFPTFSGPLGALWGTQNARATHAAVDLCNRSQDRFIFITVNPDRTNPRKELSMSWWLSKHVQKYLDEQIDDLINLEALEKSSPRQRVD